MDQPSQSSTLADLTACVRRTHGIRPPPLVGCSVTLVGDSIYVFGGRLVPTRTMVSSIYELNLNTLTWKNLTPNSNLSANISSSSTSNILQPAPRYFHSAESWGSKIIIFGGEGYTSSSTTTSPSSQPPHLSEPTSDPNSIPLCTLGDLWIFDTLKQEWSNPSPTCAEGIDPPEGRYAHLSVVNSSCVEEMRGASGLIFGNASGGGAGRERERSTLTIIGGQDLANTYLHSVNVLDLDEMRWVRVGKWEKHIGTYRAVVATSKYTIDKKSKSEEQYISKKGGGEGNKEELDQISYSKKPTVEDPTPLLIFSNFNFTQVRRDLDLLSAPIAPAYSLEATSLSSYMTGSSLPPGLRFPTGTIIGHHLLIFGTFLSTAVDNFSIWALDLGTSNHGAGGGSGGSSSVLERVEKGQKLEWMRVDPGTVLSKGSWNRAVCWNNTVVVVGDRERSIATDYNHRQTNFAHVAFVDLEAFGIYQPPMQPMSLPAETLGLLSLAQPSLADFEIISSDGLRIGCSRRVLETRWSWFKELVISKREHLRTGSESSNELLSVLSKETSSQLLDPLSITSTPTSSSSKSTTTVTRADSNSSGYTSRTLFLPESSSTIQAFLQYLYTHTLCTSLQLSLPILTSLLLFSKIYEEPNLTALVVHALHETLSLRRGEEAAATVYNVAGVAGCTALQIRALRLMMSHPRIPKKIVVPSPELPSPDPSLDDGDDTSRKFPTPSTSTRPPPPNRGLRSNLRPTSRNGSNATTLSTSNQIQVQTQTQIQTKKQLNYEAILIPASPIRRVEQINPLSVSPHPVPGEPLPNLPQNTSRTSSRSELIGIHTPIYPLSFKIKPSRDVDEREVESIDQSTEVEVVGNYSPTKRRESSSLRVLRRSNSAGKKNAEQLEVTNNLSKTIKPVEERGSSEFGSTKSTVPMLMRIPEGQKLKSNSGLGLSEVGYDVRMLGLDGRFSSSPEDSTSFLDQIHSTSSNSTFSSPSPSQMSPRQLFPSLTSDSTRRHNKRHEYSRDTSVTSGRLSSVSSGGTTDAGISDNVRTRQSSFSSLESLPHSSDPFGLPKDILPVQPSIPLQPIRSPLPTLMIPDPIFNVELPSTSTDINLLSLSTGSRGSSLYSNRSSNTKKSTLSFLKSRPRGIVRPPGPKISNADRPVLKFDSRSPTGIVIIRPPIFTTSPTLLISSEDLNSPLSPRGSLSATSVNSRSTTQSESSSLKQSRTIPLAIFPPLEIASTSAIDNLKKSKNLPSNFTPTPPPPPPPQMATNTSSSPSSTVYLNSSASQSKKSLTSNIFKRSKSRPFVMPGGY